MTTLLRLPARYFESTKLRVPAAVMTLAAMFIACQSNESSQTQSSESHLIMAWDAVHEPASLDGHIEPYQPSWLIDSLIADPLMILGPDGKHHPALASGWESSKNADTWTFFLKEGITFQDGTNFNAEAVKFNIERILAPETRSAEMAAQIGPIKYVEIINDFALVLHYERPWVNVLDAFRRVPIWSPSAASKWSVQEFDRHLVGAGPFKLSEWVPNDHVTVEKWDDYGGWNSISKQKGPAYLDRVTIRFIGEEAVLGNMVRTGNAHIAMNLPTAYISDYIDKNDFHLVKGFQAGTGLSMVMNTRNPPFNILEFRQALLYGTNQLQINELLYDGNYLISDGPLNKVHPCYWDKNEGYYPYDPDKAQALLENIGYVDSDNNGFREAQGVVGVKDGSLLSFRWTVLHTEEIGEAIQTQWRKLGIDLKIEIVPGPIQLEQVNNRDFDLMYMRQRSPDPMLLDMVWNSSYDVVGGWSWSGFIDKQLDQTVSKLRTVADQSTRCEISYKAQKIIMDNALLLPTLSEPIFYAVSNKVTDFQLMSEGQFFFLHNTQLIH